jgi:predicted transcriptional regulator
MVLSEVAKLSGGIVITSHSNTGVEVDYAFASDLMSDVLTTDIHNLLLITGLSNLQTIRTAEMADIFGIVLVRGKKATEEMKRLANEHGIVIIETEWSMFRVCGALTSAGLKPVF